MSYTYYFEKLRVGQDVRKFVDEIYLVTDSFPNSERFNLISQMRRAAVSVATNLVEGMGKNTGKEQSHFTTTAFSSLMEVLVLLILSSDRKYINPDSLENLRILIDKISLQLNALKKKQKENN